MAVKAYDYRWVYTKAQIELLTYDAPITVYKASDKKNDIGGECHKPDKEKCEEAVRKWNLRRAKRKFDLKKFLGSGLKEESDNTKKD